MGATSRVASSKVALSNVRMEEEEAPAEEKKDSVLDSAPACRSDAQQRRARLISASAQGGS